MSANPLQRAVVRACTDAAYRNRLLADARSALREVGIDVPADVEVRVHEARENQVILVLPTQDVCATDGMPQLPGGRVADVPEGLTLEWRGGALVAKGVINGDTAQTLRRELERAPCNIDLDLSGVHLLTSAGIGALVAVQQKLKSHDCRLRLRMVPEEIRNVLELAGLADVFEIHALADHNVLFPRGASFLFGGVGPTAPGAQG